MKNKSIFKRLDVSYVPLAITALLALGIIFTIFKQTQSILTDRLRERVNAITSTASLQFTSDEIVELQKLGETDSGATLNSKQLKNVIGKLKKVRDANKNIRFIYIWGRTVDPELIEFIADAEMIEPIDVDSNGEIEGDEIPPFPGEDYEISKVPSFNEGFDHPTTEHDFVVDKWGTFLTGMAPIRDASGVPVAVIGMDIEVGDFNKMVRALLIPFVLFATLLMCLLSVQTVALVRIWRSRVEIVQEVDRQKDELLGIVSHQLASPVTAIKWNIESIFDDATSSFTDNQKNSLALIQSEAVNLSDLISMILDVSRIQLGKMEPVKLDLPLNIFFTEIFNVILPRANDKKINFITVIPESLPVAKLDKRLTRITIENLLTNAIKYTPASGKVTLEVKIKNNGILVTVADTGCGIPKQDQSKVFGKLYRASNVRNTVEGNGFGLYAAKGAVESQCGTIDFTSAEGKGATFIVWLPID